MGCMMHVGILGQDKKLTEKAKRKFIAEVKDILKYGTANIPEASKPKFLCGGPLSPDPASAEALNDLEDENKFQQFHKNFFEIYEKIANSLDAEGNFSLVPAMADPVALAAKLGVTIPTPSFPDGYIPYFALLVPKFGADLVKVGKTEFVVLPKLVAALPLPSPPQPPVFETPPMLGLPPSVTTSAGTHASNSGNVPPVTPPNALSTLTAVHMAMAEGIPKLVAAVIAKMPSILTKLPDITKVLADICGLVSESKMFGEIEEASTTQKAATIVLSRKTSECILINAIANTVGSAPGSLTSAIAELSSDNDKGPDIDRYTVIVPPPITVSNDKPTPVQRALQRAEELNNTSFGDSDTKGAYTSGLFYIEDLLSRSENITINGARPSTQEQLIPAQIVTLDGKGHDVQNKYAVVRPTGFSEYAQAIAQTASSCGLFIRACYSAGGATNEFFLSLYPTSHAISGLYLVGSLRNYRWITDKHGNQGIIDAIRTGYFYVKPDGRGAATTDATTNAIPISIDDIISVSVNVNPTGEITKNNFDLYMDNPLESEKSRAGKLLRAFLKPAEDRAMIGGHELTALARNSTFPALKKGDAVLVSGNSAHITLVNNDRDAGFTIRQEDDNNSAILLQPTTGYLSPPIIGIDGGQNDPQNVLPPAAFRDYLLQNKGFISQESADEHLKNAKANNTDAPYPVGTRVVDKNGTAKQLTQVNMPNNYSDGSNWLWIPLKGIDASFNTAIRSSKRNRGMIKNNTFWLGQEFVVSTDQQMIPDPTVREIVAVFKGKNFLDPDENGEIVGEMPEDRKAYISTAAFEAAIIMDLTQGLTTISSNFNIKVLENLVFPALGAYKHAVASDSLRKAKK